MAGKKTVVILVDNKVRDLDGAALIAHELHKIGVDCLLEPLEAYRAAVSAHRPELIVFNHLTANHLVAWSRRLAELGVATAVLPNEGIVYDAGVLAFMAGRHHNDAHIDLFFCWNDFYRDFAKQGFGSRTQVITSGVPRFDLYFEPWCRAMRRPSSARRPLILICTNFITAKFKELPPIHGDNFFRPWASRVPLYQDYWSAIDAHWRSRRRALDYLDALVAADCFDLIVRPHPSEEADFYREWLAKLSPQERSHATVDATSNITNLILDCDLEISCETCTTTLESWIAKKPTIGLIFERHPMWYRPNDVHGQVECDAAAKLPGLVQSQLREPEQSQYQPARRAHIRKWCGPLTGRSAEMIASTIATTVRGRFATGLVEADVNGPSPGHSPEGPSCLRSALPIRLGTTAQEDDVPRALHDARFRLAKVNTATRRGGRRRALRAGRCWHTHAGCRPFRVDCP